MEEDGKYISVQMENTKEFYESNKIYAAIIHIIESGKEVSLDNIIQACSENAPKSFTEDMEKIVSKAVGVLLEKGIIKEVEVG
ncbi:MAG: hypothetical protein CME62_03955 [Halobacteriovoraceae bacterium]|nr:hypothetical protein [Halobacteriovoraceae bacterium]